MKSYAQYPGADVGPERYREPVRVEWMSREIELLRHALTLSMVVQDRVGVARAEREAVRAALSKHLPYVVQGMSFALPAYRQGFYHRSGVHDDHDSGEYVTERDDELLSRWLWVRARGWRESFTLDPTAHTPPRVQDSA